MITTVLQTLVFAALTAGAVWWWQRRRKRLNARRSIADLATANLIGVTGVLDAPVDDESQCRIRLRDHNGREHVLEARLEDADEPLTLGAELLVIQNPTPYEPMVVVPHELPRLEDLPL